LDIDYNALQVDFYDESLFHSLRQQPARPFGWIAWRSIGYA